MYSNEDKPGFNWKDILVKIIFLIIFVLLMVWLFKINKPNLDAFYSNVFRENIKYMQDAGEAYFTNERLPKNIGDSAEITLQEMIDMNLILPFVDENGDECDTDASYVEVTKKSDEEYILTTNLVCPTEKNHVDKVLGCTNYCEDCKEEDKVIEYQYKKLVNGSKTVYSCPNGGTLSGKTCNIYGTKTYDATATTTKDTYSCPNGSTLNGTKCTTTAYSTYTALYSDPDGEYTCPTGYKLSGTKCTKTISSSSTYNATKSYTCPTGYTLNGTKCTKTTTTSGSSYDATKNTTKVFKQGTFTTKPSGYTCSTATQYVCTSSSNCPGYVTVYTSCYKYDTSYTCPNGGVLNNTKCVISGTSTTDTKDATLSYTCPNGGTLSGTKCNVTTSSKETINATYVEGEYERYCNTGDVLKNNICYVTQTSTFDATKTAGTTTYSCPSGGTLNGTTCSYSALTNQYNATATAQSINYYTYNWSTEESLSGWERTGATRYAE